MCVAAAAGLICAVIYLQMVKHMKEICEYKGRQTANALVAQAVDDCLLGENGDYLQIEYAAEGFADGGISASLSPVGLVLRGLDNESGETVEDKIVLRYADGSEYVVMDTDFISFAVAYERSDGSHCYAFNRLADAENVTEICIAAHRYLYADDSVTELELTLTR